MKKLISGIYLSCVGAWRSLVARWHGGPEVARSNRVAPTILLAFFLLFFSSCVRKTPKTYPQGYCQLPEYIKAYVKLNSPTEVFSGYALLKINGSDVSVKLYACPGIFLARKSFKDRINIRFLGNMSVKELKELTTGCIDGKLRKSGVLKITKGNVLEEIHFRNYHVTKVVLKSKRHLLIIYPVILEER